MNDSRVLPARLLGARESGGAVEVLLLRDLGGGRWECLTRPGRKTKPGTKLVFGDGELEAEVIEVAEGGNRIVEFKYDGIFLEVLERLGKMRSRRISRPNSRTVSATRPSTPRSWAAPPRPPRGCILPRSCWRR